MALVAVVTSGDAFACHTGANAPIMKFFIPGASCTDEAEAVLQSITRLEKRSMPAPQERIFRLAYEHNGERYVAEVGQPMDQYYDTRGPVIAIIGGHPLMICTPDRGVAHGDPIYVGTHCVEYAEYFDDEVTCGPPWHAWRWEASG